MPVGKWGWVTSLITRWGWNLGFSPCLHRFPPGAPAYLISTRKSRLPTRALLTSSQETRGKVLISIRMRIKVELLHTAFADGEDLDTQFLCGISLGKGKQSYQLGFCSYYIAPFLVLCKERRGFPWGPLCSCLFASQVAGSAEPSLESMRRRQSGNPPPSCSSNPWAPGLPFSLSPPSKPFRVYLWLFYMSYPRSLAVCSREIGRNISMP